MYGQYQAVIPAVPSGDHAELTITSDRRLRVDSGGGSAGSTSGSVQTVQQPEDGVALTKAAVTMTGVSAALVGADAARLVVMIASTSTNAPAAVDITGGTAALSAGIPLNGGGLLTITGKAAQSAMTQIGTNAQLLTVYTG